MSEMSPWVSLHSSRKVNEKGASVQVGLTDVYSTEETEIFETGTKRGLSARHIQMILLGGAIGTGLFIGTGSALAQCGPAPLLISYVIMSVFLMSIMNQLSEMVAFLPLPGEATMYALSRKYTSKTLSFAIGYNLFYAMVIVPPTEITACGLVIRYWSDLNIGIWITIFVVCTVMINCLPVNIFGESEFWISTIKLLCLTGLIIVGIVIFFGGAPNQHHVLGFHYWKEPGAFVEHLATGSTGRFLACWTAIIKSGFAFILSPELITACSSETMNPRQNLKKAASRFVYRLAFFYVLGIIVIGIMTPSTNSQLLSGSSDASASPYVIGLKLVGIKVLDHIVNACILTSAFSCGNSFYYSASRMLYTMALKGDAPKIFAKCNRFGVPIYSVLITGLFCPLAYLNCSDSASTVFTWLSNITTVSGFIEWLFVCIIYTRFRKAITYNGLDDRIPYRPKFQFWGCYSAIVFFSILALTNGYAVFIKGNWSVSNFFASYITIGFLAVLLLIGSVIHKESPRKWLRPIEEIDVITGLDAVEKEEELYQIPIPRNIFERFLFWVC